MISLVKLLREDFLDNISPYGTGEWVEISKEPFRTKIRKDAESRNNIYDLIHGAYIKTQKVPHFNVNSPSKVLDKPYDFWQAIDMGYHTEADAVIFGKKTRGGIKISGFGHNDEKRSKVSLIKHLTSLLSGNGVWIEASTPVSDVLIKRGCFVVSDMNTIQKLFPDSKILEKFEDGSYIRTEVDRPGGKTNREYLIGRPNI